ncbi:MAG: 50S ribosomal protein L23 [Wigglesworthia glossinidia]|nr:50S ribosomal protein L23 [Wigglesworthia glossinidia]
MIKQERILKILSASYSSEKSSILSEKYNTITFKVLKNAKKSEIKNSIKKIFNIQPKSVKTLTMKGKKKKYKNFSGKRKSWKKAYIVFEKNQNIKIMQNIE